LAEWWRQRGRARRIHIGSGPKRVNAMRLPEVATRLRELAKQLNCDELNTLAGEIARRPSGKRAPPTSAPMTGEEKGGGKGVRPRFPGQGRKRGGKGVRPRFPFPKGVRPRSQRGQTPFRDYYNACLVVAIAPHDSSDLENTIGFLCVDNFRGGFDEEICAQILLSFGKDVYQIFETYNKLTPTLVTSEPSESSRRSADAAS